MPNFNKVLRALREEEEISRLELSRRTGISQSSINMYERGEREPNFETLETFADYFNVNMDYLLGNKNQQHRNSWFKKQKLSPKKQRAYRRRDHAT